MTKGKEKSSDEGSTRERNIYWHDDQTKFMLGWYIDYKKKQHAGFSFKNQHHHKCMEALKRQFGMEVTSTQVERHFRHYKENWNAIGRAMANSGNGFDKARCMVIISESEKIKLKDTDRRLFAKPIKFFHEMRELFSKSTANGSLAKDPFTCMQDEGDSDDNDIDCYAPPEDVLPEDSDTLPIGGETNSSTNSLSDSGAKRLTENSSGAKGKRSAEKTDNGRSSKKGVKQSRIGKSADEICHTLQALQASLMAPPPPPSYDPHAALWERLEAMTITTDQKLTVGTFLARKENKGLRGFLCSSSDTTVQTWVFKFLSDNM